MKMTKKIMSLAIVFAMVMAMSVTAFAGTITVTGKAGETYTAYQIFNVTYSGKNYSYTIAETSEWYTTVKAYADVAANALELEATSTTGVYNVIPGTGFSAEKFAAALDLAKADKTGVSGTIAKDATTVAITVAEAGYYFVDSTMGALCILYTADADAEVEEKNVAPTVTKTVNDEEAEIGETVTYTITVKDGKGTDAAITVHDVMEAGLTLDKSSFEVKANGNDVASENYTITTEGLTDGCTFEIVFTAAYVASLDTAAEVVITYDAMLDADAEITTATNDNTTWLTYQAQKSTEATAKVSTFTFNLKKTDGTNVLAGAEFELYEKITVKGEGEAKDTVSYEKVEVVPVYKMVEGKPTEEVEYYRPVLSGEEAQVIKVGQTTINGLDSDKTYVLLETKAPNGYNILTNYVDVTLGTEVVVVNQTGTELPSTGGIGTTIFYALGGLMAVGAGVLLVAKKRMEA